MAATEYLGLVNSTYTSGNNIGGTTFTKTARGYWELTLAQSGTPTVQLIIGGATVLLNDGDALVAEELKTVRFNTPNDPVASFALRLSASVTIRTLTLEHISG